MGPIFPDINKTVELEFKLPPCKLTVEDVLSIISIGAPSSLEDSNLAGHYVNVEARGKNDRRLINGERTLGYPTQLLEYGFPKRVKHLHWVATGQESESISIHSLVFGMHVKLKDVSAEKLKEKEALIKKIALKRLRKNPLPYLNYIPAPVYLGIVIPALLALNYMVDMSQYVYLAALWGSLAPMLFAMMFKPVKFVPSDIVVKNETE